MSGGAARWLGAFVAAPLLAIPVVGPYAAAVAFVAILLIAFIRTRARDKAKNT